MKTWQKIKQNPKVLKKYLVREQVIDIIRDFFKKQGFHEVQTPILVPVPSSESNLEVFKTQLRQGEETRDAYLILSPEYSLKKLVTAGVGNVFEITRAFRNEEQTSGSHNPEFTILEWYRVGADYKQIMKDFERMMLKIVGGNSLAYQGETYDLSLPWPRISVVEAFEKYAGIETETLLSSQKLGGVMTKKGYQVDGQTTWEQMFYQVFFNEIEPELKKSHKPMFIFDYPLEQAALARRKASDSRFAERFEVFLAGLELGNAFSELTDEKEQRIRFEKDLQLRKEAGKTEFGPDEDFLAALASGMPEVAGIAVGVDRLIMLAADVPTVAETLFFPAADLW